MPYGPIDPSRDVPAVARLIAHAFAGTPEGSEEWIRAAGLEHERILRESAGDPPVACLLRIPMGQFFGGRSVPMLGIAGVAVAPEARGRGHAARLMREAMIEARRDGFPLSCLYASTQALYRKSGFEQAGHRFMTRIALRDIDVRDRAGAVAPLTDADDERIRACYTDFARRFSGTLDRGPYCWGRVREFRGEKFHGFGVPGSSGTLDGYLFLTQRRKPDTGRHDVVLTDIAFATRDAGRRLLGFLADFATVGDDLLFPGGPHHPVLALLPQQRYTIAFKDYWMLRIVDARAALESRGYAPALDAELHLDLRDDLIPENTGRFVLRISGGRATLAEGGRAELSLTTRALAAAYTGFIPAPALPLTGEASGDERSLATLGAIFSGGTPWMTDFF